VSKTRNKDKIKRLERDRKRDGEAEKETERETDNVIDKAGKMISHLFDLCFR